MFHELKNRLQSVAFAATIVTACLAGSSLPAMGPVQISSPAASEAAYPRDINVRQAREKLGDGAFFLDVRESSEWDIVRIPGSVLIPLSQLQNRLDEIPTNKDIVIVCASGSRSKMALNIVRKEGFENSSSMSGGIQLWRQLGYPIEEGK